ncbi:MAG: M20/M25/M40 family metallo-hydrolase [Desulfuromonadales bacterium]
MSTRLERVWRSINRDRLRKTFLNLLDIYSPSGKEEDIQVYLEGLLTTAGFSVERQEVDEDRYNLRVTMGPGEPRLYLVGHVDTVPAWDLDEFGPEQEDGIVRGLGSADMKGGCAAMVEAWLALADALEPVERPSAGLLLVVGEEENGDGSATFLQSCRPPPWVIIGEPTGLSAKFAHYGYLEAGFVTRGIRSHSSLPELGHNAVESMLRVLLFLGNDPLFNRETSEIVYSIREMKSSQAGFVVPDRCEAWIDIHLPPDYDPDTLQDVIRRIVAGVAPTIPGLDLDVTFDFASAGYNLGTDNRLAQILREVYPRLDLPLQFEAFRSHSDGNLFYAAGVKPLILGPGALETAHTPDEHVPFDEVQSAAHIYAALCLLKQQLSE